LAEFSTFFDFFWHFFGKWQNAANPQIPWHSSEFPGIPTSFCGKITGSTHSSNISTILCKKYTIFFCVSSPQSFSFLFGAEYTNTAPNGVIFQFIFFFSTARHSRPTKARIIADDVGQKNR
jgi:hypothetical protein